jgi:tetratricopeptide (TPR) repeat protein
MAEMLANNVLFRNLTRSTNTTMDIVEQMIARMGKDELRFFRMYASRMEVKGPRKDMQLFDRIRTEGTAFSDEAACDELYTDGNRNAYYRLKNRLKTELAKSLLLQHIESEDTSQVLHLLLLARHYQTKNAYALAEHFLKKAERKAGAAESHELLDLIYTEFIRLSQEVVTIDPETYIAKRRENSAQLHMLRQMDEILATVKYRLKVTQNFSPVNNPVIDMLLETVQRLSSDERVRHGTQLRFKMYHAVSQILLQQHDYPNLEDFLLKTFSQFEEERLFNRANHQTKLQMLTYIVNALFKNGKTAQSLEWAERLHDAMNEHDRLLYDRFLFFYYNSLVINYTKTDLDRAIALLLDLENHPKLRDTQYYLIFVHLNLSIFFFQKGDHRQAIRRLNQLHHHERFPLTATPLRLRIAMFELMVRTELGDMDVVEQRLKQVRQTFAEQLKQGENRREAELLTIIEKLFLKGISPREREMAALLKAFTTSTSPEEQDAELLNYNGWLVSKVKV